MRELSFRPRARVTLLGLYGAVGLVLAVSVHVGAYTDRVLPTDDPLFWGMHIAIFPLFFAMFLRLRPWRDPEAPDRAGSLTPLWRELLPFFPRWVPPLVIALFCYVVVNFLIAHFVGPGTGRVRSGEALRPELVPSTVRAFSGHWLVFYAMPMLFFTYVPPDARPKARVRDAAA